MKIVDVKIHVLKSPLAEPFAFSQGWVRQRSATLVEVLTDEGITGWGEAFAQGLEPPEIAAAAIEYALKPLILGANPLDTEVLWHKMYHATRDYGRKGSVIAAISAVDIALWDIAGKTHGVPIHVLLGGAFRSRVQPYATGFYRVKGQGESARLADEAIRHHDAGFRTMKVKLGYGVDDDIKCMQAIRDAIDGRGITLMIDTNHAYGRADALRLGRALESYNLRWYEEPVVPEDLRGYSEMRDKLTMPIAGGENEHTLFGYRDLFAANAVDIAQPASLQLIAALPVAHHSLFAQEPLLEYDCSSHPFRQQLITQPIQQHDGWVTIPDGPGLGVELARSVIERYRAC